VEVLKHFSDVLCEQIIAVHSNDVPCWPPTPECQKRVKGGVPESHDPVNFWALNGQNGHLGKLQIAVSQQCIIRFTVGLCVYCVRRPYFAFGL